MYRRTRTRCKKPGRSDRFLHQAMLYHGGETLPSTQVSPESRHVAKAPTSNNTYPLPALQQPHRLSRGTPKRSMALSFSNASILQDSISPPRHGSWRWLFAGFVSWSSSFLTVVTPRCRQCCAVGLNSEGERTAVDGADDRCHEISGVLREYSMLLSDGLRPPVRTLLFCGYSVDQVLIGLVALLRRFLCCCIDCPRNVQRIDISIINSF
jgi:hypothetical protein